jgi:NMT1/THI5 like
MRYVSSSILLSLILVVVNNGAPSMAYGQDKVRIGVPLFPTVSYPVFIAQERGFFDRNGLKAEIIRINSEPTTYQALIAGDIDATSGAPTGLVQSNIQGVPVVSLGSWDNLVSYTMVTREKIDDLVQLRGKKVGINRLGGKSSLILRVMLEDAGLNTSKDVTLLQLGGSPGKIGGSDQRGYRRRAGGFRLRAQDETNGFLSRRRQKNRVHERSHHRHGRVIKGKPRQMDKVCQSLSGSDAIHGDQPRRLDGCAEEDYSDG